MKAHSQAEIAQIDPEVVVDHNILWLDVPVNNPAFVAGADRAHQLLEDSVGLVLSEVASRSSLHKFVQVAARNVRRDHHDVVVAHHRLH
eukprot:CAMPEP_0185578502 /NCGR_PEP_ID=MMETSP0434-20130131/12970_1 /TAXON_ID=626734 ORGANISM="Favella taraikaensis, Strain Fe Narragansett Bay" /NCGR_SAMPLE_ID=MMETSP0434 /ASSEMBLY_ACC=CAM_ASM_000379 /LENGTH=88 /DNA_ID=CAMNT_0028196321 /DNA_START=541 /DNA_END=807 /DNA_ORIENTATION=-